MTYKEEELSKVKRDLCDKIDKLKKLHGSLEKKIAKQALRDKMAIGALALLGGRSWDVVRLGDEEIINQWARTSYLVADAMLIAREEKAE